MNFFKGKNQERRPKEKNEIENRELKEHIAGAALRFLSEDAGFGDTGAATVEFGYGTTD